MHTQHDAVRRRHQLNKLSRFFGEEMTAEVDVAHDPYVSSNSLLDEYQMSRERARKMLEANNTSSGGSNSSSPSSRRGVRKSPLFARQRSGSSHGSSAAGDAGGSMLHSPSQLSTASSRNRRSVTYSQSESRRTSPNSPNNNHRSSVADMPPRYRAQYAKLARFFGEMPPPNMSARQNARLQLEVEALRDALVEKEANKHQHMRYTAARVRDEALTALSILDNAWMEKVETRDNRIAELERMLDDVIKANSSSSTHEDRTCILCSTHACRRPLTLALLFSPNSCTQGSSAAICDLVETAD